MVWKNAWSFFLNRPDLNSPDISWLIFLLKREYLKQDKKIQNGILLKTTIWGCFNTPLEHTPSNLYQQAKKVGIPFIVGDFRGIAFSGVLYYGCVVIFLETKMGIFPPNLVDGKIRFLPTMDEVSSRSQALDFRGLDTQPVQLDSLQRKNGGIETSPNLEPDFCP